MALQTKTRAELTQIFADTSPQTNRRSYFTSILMRRGDNIRRRHATGCLVTRAYKDPTVPNPLFDARAAWSSGELAIERAPFSPVIDSRCAFAAQGNKNHRGGNLLCREGDAHGSLDVGNLDAERAMVPDNGTKATGLDFPECPKSGPLKPAKGCRADQHDTSSVSQTGRPTTHGPLVAHKNRQARAGQTDDHARRPASLKKGHEPAHAQRRASTGSGQETGLRAHAMLPGKQRSETTAC
jgi:hypothetical protein